MIFSLWPSAEVATLVDWDTVRKLDDDGTGMTQNRIGRCSHYDAGPLVHLTAVSDMNSRHND